MKLLAQILLLTVVACLAGLAFLAMWVIRGSTG
jgi:hypothetical protein